MAAGAAFGQAAPAAAAAKPEFEVATVKPSAPLDMQKLARDAQAGKMPNFGMHLDGLRAEYNYMALKELAVVAYKVKAYQISCPDWMGTTRYDIVARMPEGSKKDDAAPMLKTLLEDRFKLVAHLEQKELPVFALVVGKSGVKMKESPAPPPIDESAELKPGEMKMDLPDGPARMTRTSDGMGAVVNMGVRGSYTQKMDLATQSLKIDGTGVSMSGLVDLLAQMMQIGGGSAPKQVVDQTGLTGHYDLSFSFSLAELMAMAKAQGVDIPGASPAVGGGNSAAEASDPGGTGSSVYAALEKMGLKLESKKAVVQQLVIESAEKTPTED